MKLILDTNICIYIIKQQPESVLKRFLDYQVGDICISTITLSELRFGVAKSKHKAKNSKALDEFLIPLEILLFDEEAAQAYGEVRASLEEAGTPLGAMDMLIAANAVSQGLALVTNNIREFSRVSNLRIVDWVDQTTR